MKNPLTPVDRRELSAAVVVFVALLGFSFWGVGVGWKNLNLPGCEFRQAQTALSAFFIQEEAHFSLNYPTPVLGKPWSIPMEFPLYQWTVITVSNSTGLSLTETGRAVSAVCFYLCLPALYLLLGRLRLTVSRRLLVLGLILTCPLYIFYARAFLIETMALLFGLWFLLAYFRAVEQRSKRWLLLAVGAGVGCGLVKVTTFLFYLMPAFLETLRWFKLDWQQPVAFRRYALSQRVLWCTLAVIVPCAASIWWVRYTDGIKAESIAGKFLQSSTMAPYNFGYGLRFSPEIWAQHWKIITQEITSVPLLVVGGLLAWFFARRWWGWILVLVGLFGTIQLIMPVLYAWHGYYYVANALMLLLAYGLVLCGLFESRLSRWLVWLLVLVIYGTQVGSYLNYTFPVQKNYSPGGTDLTAALRRVTAPGEVLIIAGNDWSSITPYFAQRRALMIRQGLETTWDMIIPAFEKLRDEDVTALVLHGSQVQNSQLIALVQQYFKIDPRPAFQWYDATVYLHEKIRARAGYLLNDFPGIRLLDLAAEESDPELGEEILLQEVLQHKQRDFVQMTPLPYKFYSAFGTELIKENGHTYFNAYPDTRLWFKLPAGRHTLSAEVGLAMSAYTNNVPWTERSDGVEFRLEAVTPEGGRKILYSRLVNPRDNKGDQGMLRLEHVFILPNESEVLLSIGPGHEGNAVGDWALLGRVHFE